MSRWFVAVHPHGQSALDVGRSIFCCARRTLSSAQKVGIVDIPGWLAYANNGYLFVKMFG
jgi:hypothetical protein